MKIALGVILIMTSFFFLGRKATQEEKNSVKQLDNVIRLTEHIKNGVALSALPLPEIYLSFCKISDDSVFAEKLVNEGITTALSSYTLPREAEEVLDALTATLGRLDGSAQQEKLEAVCKKLEVIREKENDRVNKKSKSVQTLFLLAGALAVILMC